MAPITWSPGTWTEYLDAPSAILTKRDSSTPDANIQNSELIALMSISLSTASISVLSALYAFYWFVRMRRSFRHDLIMLLIQSDMMKALWLVICPLAFFAKLPIDSESTFCQVSGFFLTASIEASDIAVFLIAIHTALFILRPRSSNGASGLYPYRRFFYTCWAIIPLVLAAIVPITGGHFADNGPHCYLPVRPRWYLSALSWIPRYVIFGVIIFTYTGLYLYIAFRLRGFRRDQRRASTAHSDYPDQNRKHNHRHDPSGDVPPTPPIADHGLLDLVRGSLTNDGDRKDRQNSVASTISSLNYGGDSSTPPQHSEQVLRNSIVWNPVDFANNSSAESHARRQSEMALLGPTSPSLRAEQTIPIRPPEPVHLDPPNSPGDSQFTWKHSISRGTHSIAGSISNMVSALQRSPPWADDSNQSTSSSSIFLPQRETEEAMRRSREKQQRQLRLLFVYPAIYMLTWIAPFVSHVLQYDNHFSDRGRYNLGGEPIALQIVSIASLCIGAAVDCCFFSAWEKPWLHLRGGFWENLALRLRIRRPIRRSRHGLGRTREEMFVDARTARVRREQEENLENLSNEAAVAARRMSGRGERQSAPPREWWDVLDVDSSEPRTSSRLG
ncbi:G protein-coupled glucose receptor regulating Gpa2-domain-containing protein [Hypoxylon sp. FL1857]|nr:G protein-coupled glucose receptor regulating Gpa2-domain-containing protein [Hypoxylon sp. FL1857]